MSTLEQRTMKMHGVVASAMVVLVSNAACDHSRTVAPLAPFCGDGTTVQVGAGAQPEVSWTGACRAAAVRVEAFPANGTGAFEPAWEATSQDGVVSPVHVGVPRADGSYGPALLLLAGRQYRACVVVFATSTGGTSDLACQTFTP